MHSIRPDLQAQPMELMVAWHLAKTMWMSVAAMKMDSCMEYFRDNRSHMRDGILSYVGCITTVWFDELIVKNMREMVLNKMSWNAESVDGHGLLTFSRKIGCVVCSQHCLLSRPVSWKASRSY